ncbi:MAG TPA: MarR family transcriptional regulator [Stenotrophomonas sp.]|nr:MarR family transcriptional regulator [Stenotrophomonas sp.]
MDTTPHHVAQAAAGLEQLAALVRAQSWRRDGTPPLPPTQGAVLKSLLAAPSGMRATQLAERLSVSAASLSDSLKALERKGWLQREPDPLDRRASRLRLSATGHALAQQLSQPDRGMAALMGELDESDLAALLRASQLMVRQAQRQGLATGLRTCLGCRFFQPFASADARRPHLCDFTRQPFGDLELRVDCAEQEPADATQSAASLERFRQRHPPLADQVDGARLSSDAARFPYPPRSRASKRI